MVEANKHIKVQSLQTEGVDFNKLKIVFQSNWVWLLLIFFTINATAFLIVRYTKNLYESETILKLDIKNEASEFGIKAAINDQSVSIISGEIELIQSRLFLNRVLDSSSLHVSYFSIGRVLNDELYQNKPFSVEYIVHNQNLFNKPIYFDETGPNNFNLKIGGSGEEIKGKYNSIVPLNGLDLIIRKNKDFLKGDEVGYFFIINSREFLLNYLLTNLAAEPLNFSANTVRISFKDFNAFKAREILNKIDTIYLQYSNEQKNLATKQKIDWISRELVNIEKKMEIFEDYFENFTLENRTDELDGELRETVRLINGIDTLRYQLTQQINEVNALIDGLNSGNFFVSMTSRQLLPQPLAKNLEMLAQQYADQERLKLSYNETTFAYRMKEAEIKATSENVINQLIELKKESIKNLAVANQNKSRLENKFVSLPGKSTEISKNLRFYRLNERFYLSLMESKSGFEIAQAGSIPDFKILTPATLPTSPISPNKPMITGIGFVASIIMILLVIGTLYLTNNRITSLSEIERIDGLPVLGIVPSSKYLTDVELHVIGHPKSMVTEAIRTLRTNLDFFNVQGRKKVIAISSTVSGEGKSFIAMNLGGVLALSKKKVILLDLDMRKPKNVLDAGPESKSKGISTVLIRKNSWQECLIKTSVENFDFIPSGPHPPNPSELLMHSEFEVLLEELKQQYDYIILDTPPVGLVTDGIMAMKRADISIYIFRANYSKKDFLFTLQRIININKFSNITTLLNALPNHGDQSYGYGYYEEPKKRHWLKKIINR